MSSYHEWLLSTAAFVFVEGLLFLALARHVRRMVRRRRAK